LGRLNVTRPAVERNDRSERKVAGSALSEFFCDVALRAARAGKLILIGEKVAKKDVFVINLLPLALEALE
jgi:hypothetical protein